MSRLFLCLFGLSFAVLWAHCGTCDKVSLSNPYMDNSYLVDPFDDVTMDSELKIKLDALRDAFLRSKHAYLDALHHVPDTVLVEYLKSNEFSVPVSTN